MIRSRYEIDKFAQRAVRVGLVATLLGIPGCGSDLAGQVLLQFSGQTMGTSYTVKVARPPDGIELSELQAGVDEVLEKVNDQMSTYRAESELSRLNRSTSTQWTRVSADLLYVIDAALAVSRLTDGAFDVTVGPLVNLWGFGPETGPDKVPSEQQIKRSLSGIGYRKLHARHSPPSIRKEQGALYVDLSAIAKGYGVDKVAERLEESGIRNYLVEIGGEMKAMGHRGRGDPWNIAIERPLTGHRIVQRVVHIGDQAIATSGDYRNYFEVDGRRFSHTINPRTGMPIAHDLASVAVVADSCMYADALATALMVLGPEAGYALAERQNLAVLFISRDGNGFVEKITPQFRQYLVSQDS